MKNTIFLLIIIITTLLISSCSKYGYGVNKKRSYWVLDTYNINKKIIFKGQVIKGSNMFSIYYFKLENNKGWVLYWERAFLIIDMEGNIKAKDRFSNEMHFLNKLAEYDSEFNTLFNKKYRKYIYVCGPPSVQPK